MKINSYKNLIILIKNKMFKLKLPTTNYQLPTNFGFTLIELLMVISIMTLITSVVLFNHSRFSGGVILENLAYDIALTVRQAQFFGINVRETSLGGGGFDSGYGVYFDKSNPTSFIFFADTNNNHYYDGIPELIEIYNIIQGNHIIYLCVDSGCVNPESSTVDEIQVTFRRPDPNAFIKTESVADCGAGASDSCGSANIYISSLGGNIPNRIVSVSSTGQISISVE